MVYESIFRENLFEGKVIIVTGGGTGIGRTIAHELASLGAAVALGSRKIESCEQVKHELEGAGVRAFAGECNIREPESVNAFVDSVLQTYGKIDGLVNNGGGQFLSPAHMISEKGWNAVIETNLTGTWNMTKAVMLKSMQEHGGAIVNIPILNLILN